MSSANSLKSAWADFTDIAQGNQIWVANRSLLPGETVTVGETIELADGDDNRCLATIVSMDGHGFTCELDWETWSSVVVKMDQSEQGELTIVTTPDLTELAASNG